jgi:hypothetical protein
VFTVANPNAGDTLKIGGLMVQGVAYDKAATQGSGVDRIAVFLDDPNAGGMPLGQVVLPFTGNNWTTTVIVPSNKVGSHRLFFDAHSSGSGADAIVSIPVTFAP